MTAFSEITAAFESALSRAPAVAQSVTRANDRPVPANLNTAVNVRFEGSQPDRGAIRGAPIDWLSRVSVECYAKASSDGPDVAVDAVMNAVYCRLAEDETLGGMADDIGVPMIEADYDAQAQKTGWVRMTYTVVHRTANNNLEQA